MQVHTQDAGCCQRHAKERGGALTSKHKDTLANQRPDEKLECLDNNNGKGLGLVIWADRR